MSISFKISINSYIIFLSKRSARSKNDGYYELTRDTSKATDALHDILNIFHIPLMTESHRTAYCLIFETLDT